MRLANKLYVFLPRDPLQEAESSRLCGSAARSSRARDSRAPPPAPSPAAGTEAAPGADSGRLKSRKGFPLPKLAASSPSAMERQIPVLRVR